MVISQTISEKFKINRFVFSIYSPRGNKIVFENYFITSWGIDWKDKTVNFEFLRDGLRYHHQIFTSCQTLWEPALYQIWRLLVHKIWISRQNRQKHQMGVAGSIFEPHPPNFVRIQFFMSCKNAEIFVMISQVVPDLAKISVSQTSISRDVLVLSNVNAEQC